MHPRLAAIAARQGGPFTTAQALTVGYDYGEVQRLLACGHWLRLRRGAYVEARLATDLDPVKRHVLDLRAVVLTLGRPAVASHVTAAAVHGLPLLEPDLRVLHMTRHELAGSRREAGVQHHAALLPPEQRTTCAGLPVTSLARTAIDVARTNDLRTALVMCDATLAAGVPLTELQVMLDFCREWPGSRTAGRAVTLADAGAESPGESLARLVCIEQGLPSPSTQQIITDERGVIGRVDLLWKQERTVGEFDGRVKYGVGPDEHPSQAGEVLWREKRREDRLSEAGYEVVRIVWADLFGPAALAARIRAAFARGGRRVLPAG